MYFLRYLIIVALWKTCCLQPFSLSYALDGSLLTLSQAYELATQKMETIAKREASIAQAKAETKRRWSVISPTLSLKASELIQDTSGTVISSTTGNDVGNTFVRRSRPEVALNLSYTFFSGGREFSAIAGSKATERSQIAQKERALQLLYRDVAQVFYNVIQLKRELATFNARHQVLQDRIEELQRFEKLGRSRASERISVKADQKALEADINLLQTELDSAQITLSFFIGLDPAPSLAEEEVDLPFHPISLDTCFLTLSSRPDIKSLKEEVIVSQKQVRFEKGAYWPTAEVQANYYPYRVGFTEEIDWDVLLLLNFPFFEGGRSKAEIQKTKAFLSEAELNLKEQERLARVEAQVAQAKLLGNLARLKSLEEAIKLEEENYRLQKKEYSLGLVTNLEVLSALSKLYETKRDMETTKATTKIQEANLFVACGKIP